MKPSTRVWKPGKPSNVPFWKESSVVIWGSQDGVDPAFTLMPPHGCHSQTCQRSLWVPPACHPRALAHAIPGTWDTSSSPSYWAQSKCRKSVVLGQTDPSSRAVPPAPQHPHWATSHPHVLWNSPGTHLGQPPSSLPQVSPSQKPRKQGICSAALPTLHVSCPPPTTPPPPPHAPCGSHGSWLFPGTCPSDPPSIPSSLAPVTRQLQTVLPGVSGSLHHFSYLFTNIPPPPAPGLLRPPDAE